jgi:outer membrane protein
MKRPLLLLLLLWLVTQTMGAAEPRRLSLQDVRDQVLKSHPRISVAELRALAARQVVIENRAGFFPLISANATAVGNDGEANTRIAAGGLNNPSVYERAAVGASISQLITDFGRTANLTEASKLRAQAAATNIAATRAQLLLEVDGAYFSALAARAVKTVAARTLDNRKLLLDQVSTLASNQLKSELDVRFAQVGMDEARLLASKAEKDWQAALAILAGLLGQRDPGDFTLQEEPAPERPPDDAEPLIALALRQRPELVRLRIEREAAIASARAERGLSYPTISAFGAAGVIPEHDSHFDHEYAAAGLNLNLPLFAGGQHEARRKEAELLSEAAGEALHDAEISLIREVRLAWLEAGQARERIRLTTSLLDSSNGALDLARARFEQGLSSIIELNQADLNQTAAALARASAEYEYRTRLDLLDYQTGSLR